MVSRMVKRCEASFFRWSLWSTPCVDSSREVAAGEHVAAILQHEQWQQCCRLLTDKAPSCLYTAHQTMLGLSLIIQQSLHDAWAGQGQAGQGRAGRA